MDERGPIFIGGTGRSGTTVMANLLNSHPRIVLPAHENKLIVERGGLRDLVDQLGGRFDMKRHHYAVMDFVRWAQKLRSAGFRNPAFNEQVATLMKDQGLGFQPACEAVAREHPGAELSIHGIGNGFGRDHYDATVNAFIRTIAGQVVEAGIVDTEGLIRPFLIPEVKDRDSALQACRGFLDQLYALPMSRAGAVRWCDDTPSNWLYLDFLFELYPDMKFIHMIRDPRDVVGSYMKQVWAPSDPRIIVAIFKAQFSDYEYLLSQVPRDRVMEIRMEDISSDKPRIMDELSRFLGEENLFNSNLFFDERTNTGTYADSLGPEATCVLETELGSWMERHRYLS
ncbi:MAG: sulfotransferase [Phenylobacterium sp.]|nr:sulfotransferase [Phenylobacterium sp.]